MREWLVQLKGEEEDLKALSEIFCAPNFNIRKDEDGEYYYLRSSDFALIADESARDERAIELVGKTNVAARLLLGDNYFAVEFDRVVWIGEDGQRHWFVHKDVHLCWHVRTSYKDAAPEEAESLIALLDDQELQRVVSLFAHSLNTKDEFKRFLYGWKALEIYISKVFRRYRRDFNPNKVAIPATSQHFERLTQAIKADKYALLDKFGVIVAVLAKKTRNVGIEELDSDVDEFQRLKNLRDALFHRPDVAEASLPTVTVELQSLLSKYLRLHLEHTNS